ncbi:MAG: S-layer homology domain-containing protein [Clostridia bacterium]|nr:S-layer homology domain-containing protein [Clostridia bacterium]
MDRTRAICLITAVIMLFSSASVLADGEIVFSDEMNAAYGLGDTVVVKGTTSFPYINVLLNLPEAAGGGTRYMTSVSKSDFERGILINIGTDLAAWPIGTYTIIVGSSNISATFEFELGEESVSGYIDPDEYYNSDDDEPTEATSSTTSGGNTGTSLYVTADKPQITLAVGESETVKITVLPAATRSISWITEDNDIVSLSGSGDTATITAKKVGAATVWAYVGEFYAQINVTVRRAAVVPTESTETTEATEATEASEATEPTENAFPLFSDMDEAAWATDAVMFLANRGIVQGYDGKFNPNGAVTRAEFAAMLIRALDVEMLSPAVVFSDVTQDDWFYTVVTQAQRANIVQGYGGLFNPLANVTRQDAAVMACRAWPDAPVSDMTVIFDDHTSIASYAIESVYSMKNAGIINGMTASIFAPLENTTRAQAAKIVYELISR